MRDIESFSEENRPIIAALRDDDESVRLRTVRLLIEDVDDEIAGELLLLLQGASGEALRAQVAIALGPALEGCDDELGDDGRLPPPGDWSLAPLSTEVYERLVETLQRIFDDAAVPRSIRRRVLEAAVRSPRPWQREAVAAAYRSADEDWRVTAVFCMGYLVGFKDQIVEAFGSGSDALIFEAIQSAGHREIRELGRGILGIAGDPGAEPQHRLAAIEALPSLAPEDAFELLEDLCAATDEDVASAAEEAMEELTILSMVDEDLDDEDEEDTGSMSGPGWEVL